MRVGGGRSAPTSSSVGGAPPVATIAVQRDAVVDPWQSAIDTGEAERQSNRAARDLHRQADAGRIANVVRKTFPSDGSAAYKVTETELVMDTEADCNGRDLMRVRAALDAKILDRDGFDSISCGTIADKIDLHTANGCAPGQSDQLILTDGGVRRDKLSQALGNATDEIRRGFLVTAMGCDATVLTITQISGGDAVCDKARIETMARDGGAAFKRSGFTSIKCDATGDVVELR